MKKYSDSLKDNTATAAPDAGRFTPRAAFLFSFLGHVLILLFLASTALWRNQGESASALMVDLVEVTDGQDGGPAGGSPGSGTASEPAAAPLPQPQEEPEKLPEVKPPPVKPFPVRKTAAKIVAGTALLPKKEEEPRAVEEPAAVSPEGAGEEQAAAGVIGGGGGGNGGALSGRGSGTGVGGRTGGGYGAVLLRWFRKHKFYPDRARRARQEGETVLRIRISRSGTVLRSSLERRSGSALLDEAAQEIVRRADPFPPVPDGINGEHVEFLVPVRFKLR